MNDKKTYPTWRWIAGMFCLLLGLPIVGLWGLASHESYPVEVLMPARLGAAVRLSHAEAAWQRHWLRRSGAGQTKPEDALQRILEAMDQWPREVKKYGETQARLRLSLYQRAFFTAMGDEAWLIFGEWGGSGTAGQPAQAGLVALLRADGSVKSRVGPLADLLLEDYNIEHSTYKGVPVYEYKDRRLGRSMTFCQVGGWICTSLRRRGPGPLYALIDQAIAAKQHGLASVPHQDLWPRRAGDLANPAIALTGSPGSFWTCLREFSAQRERSISKKSRKKLGHWEQAFQGIDRIALVQDGDSLLDLRLELQGEKAASLSKSLAAPNSADAATTAGLNASAALNNALTAASPAGPAPAGAGPAPVSEAELAQVELSLAFARMAAPLAGLSWKELIKDMKGVDLLLPGLRERLRGALDTSQVTSAGRVGLAAYPSHQTLFPGLLYWLDEPPERPVATSPAPAWRAVLERGKPTDAADPSAVGLADGTGDACLWVSPFTPLPAGAAAGAAADWFRFEDALLARPAARPLGFAALNFPALSTELRSLPLGLLSKKYRKRSKRWVATSDALALTFGGVALRLDAQGDRWVLSSRTP